MSKISEVNEQLAAIKEEGAALKEKQLQAFAELGETALPKLRGKEEYAEVVAKIDEIAAETGALDEKEAGLLAELEKLELEEKERIAKLTCYYCKTVSPDDARFCENCGAKLGEPPREYCTNCDTMNQPDMKFCGECGSKLEEK